MVQADVRQRQQTTSGAGSGWLIFAAIVLGIAGIMRFFDAIWAFSYHGVLPESFEGAIFGHSLKTYGWVWLVVAVIYVVCALTIFTGSQLARWVGVAGAAIGAFTAIWWMPFYPVWSLVYVGLGVMVIYGLVAHGGRSEA
ncbi:MAG TPA: hypothetical protein VGH43_04880 [Jatrophihabitans sp.]|jgi:hypothetical protein